MVKKCLSCMSGKLSRTVLRRGKGSNPFSLVNYDCYAYRDLLKRHHIQQSMSRRGNPYDNAAAENFFNCLKCEFVYLRHFSTRQAAQTAIFRYIETYYNSVCPHSGIGWLSPNDFEKFILSNSVA